VATIVAAARLVQDEADIRFEMVGDGPDRAPAEELARAWGLRNITFTPWLGPEALVTKVAGADLCLGAFGGTPQSLMTVHNKIYEALAMRLCVVTGDSPAVRAAFSHGRELWLCRRAEPAALAEAILVLKADSGLRASMAERGYRAFLSRYAPGILGAQFRQHIECLLQRRRY
jgi:glycosyltransferase involved in cell wall biosynthesis